MTKMTPLFAKARTAAQLFDMSEDEFVRLVENGHLPPAADIGGGIKRWDVEQLRKIAGGEAADEGTMEW